LLALSRQAIEANRRWSLSPQMKRWQAMLAKIAPPAPRPIPYPAPKPARTPSLLPRPKGCCRSARRRNGTGARGGPPGAKRVIILIGGFGVRRSHHA
jgi:hypothetical protein